MKYLIVLLLSFLVGYANAQAGKQEIPLQGATELSVSASLSGVLITASPQATTITVRHILTINGEDRPEYRDLKIERAGKVLRINELKPTTEVLKNEKGSQGMSIIHNGGDDWSNGHNGVQVRAYLEITIPESLTVTAETLYGGIEAKGVKYMPSARSTYGTIEVVFAPDCRIEKLDFESTYQSVDVALPADIAANISLNTSYGSMYSDFNYRVPASRNGIKHEGKLIGTINGGGVPISLTATYQNIYLRKL